MSHQSASSIQVYTRIRHTNDSIQNETDQNETDHYSVNQMDSSLVLQQLQKQAKKSNNKAQLKFGFNHIFSCNTNQQSVFNKCGKSLVHQSIKGYNCTLLAYGQTGSGKTYSMLGPPTMSTFNSSNNEHGLIYRCMNELFTHLNIKDTNHKQHSLVKCSFVEIYQDKMRDLLLPRPKSARKSKTAFGKGLSDSDNKALDSVLKIKTRYKSRKPCDTFVTNLTEEYVSTIKDIEMFVGIAKARRATCATLMNAYSSRSHWVMVVTIEQKTHDSCTTVSKLNFVDLAGSEKIKKTGVTGNSMEEAKTINKSLHNLRLCISALANRNSHIPYRDSTLTHLLQDSIGGNTKTSLLITLNMDKDSVDETISSCRFGGEAQNVINVASINKRASRKQLESLIAKLQKDLHKKGAVLSVDPSMDENNTSLLSVPDCTELFNLRKRVTELGKSIQNYEKIIHKIKSKRSSTKVLKANMDDLSKLCEELRKDKATMQQSIKKLTSDNLKIRKNYKCLKEKNNSLQKVIGNNDRMCMQVSRGNLDLFQRFDDLQQSNNAKFDLLFKEMSYMSQYKSITNHQTLSGSSIDLESDINSNLFCKTPQIDLIHEDEDAKREQLPITGNHNEISPISQILSNVSNPISHSKSFCDHISVQTSNTNNLEFEENVIEFSIMTKPVVCTTSLIEAYFTNMNDDGNEYNNAQEPNMQCGKRIKPSPIRILIKMIRLITPNNYRSHHSHPRMHTTPSNTPAHAGLIYEAGQ